MGFSFRRRNPEGLNVSASSRGARTSKTVKMGGLSLNFGHTLEGTGSHGGKTTGRATVNLGNGLTYRRDATLGTTKPTGNFVPYDGDTLEDSGMSTVWYSVFLFIGFISMLFLLCWMTFLSPFVADVLNKSKDYHWLSFWGLAITTGLIATSWGSLIWGMIKHGLPTISFLPAAMNAVMIIVFSVFSYWVPQFAWKAAVLSFS